MTKKQISHKIWFLGIFSAHFFTAKTGSVATVLKVFELGADTVANDEKDNTAYNKAMKNENYVIADIIQNYDAKT